MEKNKKYSLTDSSILDGLRVVEEGLTKEEKSDLWIRIGDRCRARRPLRPSALLRYAAAIVLLAAGSAYFLLTDRPGPGVGDGIDYMALLVDTVGVGDPPGNVTVIMAGGERIEIEEENASLRLDDKGRISVNTKVIGGGKDEGEVKPVIHQLIVPFGKTGSIELSDGTRVWVNSGSRVIYPSVFGSVRREIFIDGEAYLEVARDDRLPFVVKTDLLEVSVLGTSFNVSGYKNDGEQSIVLAQGSVKVKKIKEDASLTLLPNRKYSLDKLTGATRVEDVDIFDYICWKYGFLSFKNEKLSDVLRKIERYYNVKIVYKASDTDLTTVSGKLDLREDIKETFRIISIATPIKHSILKNGSIKIDVKP
ncbi:MAG: FecR domain-containing protein [Tannerellaceae bacterium]|jgi:hypothetical protein|nr:FecR domain-containing protein [Tannerellaceae bacterium]